MLPDDVERAALLGWHCYPVAPGSRFGAWRGAEAAATCDLDTLAAWARDWPGCGWRVVCGPSRIWALDVDAPEAHAADGFATLAGLVAKHGALPIGPAVRSGGNGLLLVYRWQGERLRGAPGAAGPGLDPRRGAQTVTIPPTCHHRTRQPYIWLREPWNCAIPSAPKWLVDLLAPPRAPRYARCPSGDQTSGNMDAIRNRLLAEIQSSRQGMRNHMLNTNGFTLALIALKHGVDLQSVRHDLANAARAAGIDWPEAKATITSCLRGAWRAWR